MRVMPDLTLDLRYLKYAIHVAEAGSFRRAADRLSISQSTVSRRVQMLERQLGVSLFKRTRSGAGLTPEGERFLQQAAVGARYLREAATEMRSVRKLTTGLVRFGMLEAFPACPIIDLLATFRQRYTTIEVKLEEGTSEQNTLGVERGLLDAAISLGATKGHPFQIRRLCEPDLFVALSGSKLFVDLRGRVCHHVPYSFYFSPTRVKSSFCLLRINRYCGGSRAEDRCSLVAKKMVLLA